MQSYVCLFGALTWVRDWGTVSLSCRPHGAHVCLSQMGFVRCTSVPGPSSEDVSQLLAQWEAGDRAALGALVPRIYNELHRLAHHYLRKERPGHTLQTTALVHEAYLRLEKHQPTQIPNRAQLLAVSALLMRQILIQYERSRRAAKRGRGCTHLTIEDTIAPVRGRSVDLIALDDALNNLARLNSQQSRVVELRFFGGLSIEETAEVLGISSATVKRQWAMARVWLHHEMSRDGQT